MNAAAIAEVLRLSQVARMHGVSLSDSPSQKCPFCENPKRFRVTRDRYYRCYSCNRHGDIFKFVQDLNLAATFKEAFQLLAKEVDNSESLLHYKARVAGYRSVWEIYQAAANGSAAIKSYAESRGWNLKLGEVGYANQPNQLQKKGFSVEQLSQLGLYAHGREHFYNHLIFPVLNQAGEVVHFSGRSLDPDDELRWKHTPTVDSTPINNFLYNSNGLHGNYAVICEGISDSRSMVELGEPAVGVFGVTIPLVHHAALFRNCSTLVAFFDRDKYPRGHEKEGVYKSWSQVTPHLIDLAIELKVPVLCLQTPDWPGVKDVNEYLEAIDYDRQTYRKWAKQANRPLQQFAWELYRDDITQHHRIWQLLKAVPDATTLAAVKAWVATHYNDWTDYVMDL